MNPQYVAAGVWQCPVCKVCLTGTSTFCRVCGTRIDWKEQESVNVLNPYQKPSVCHKCKSRTIDCHSWCQKYLQEVAEKDQQKEQKKEELLMERYKIGRRRH